MMHSVFCLLLLCTGTLRSFTSANVLPEVTDDNHWSYLILAQFWPESSCIYFKEKGGECSISPKVKGWTIHGLWPSRPDSTEFPHDCDPSMTFDMSKIEVLRPRLDLEWPYYKAGGERTYLWNHEWTKHGTCAQTLPDLRGELKYFNKTLELHSHLNHTKALENSNIVPSHEDTYKREDFFNAVLKYYKVKPYIVCDWDEDEKKAYIDQIYLCYNKTFGLQDCYPTPSKNVAHDDSGTMVYHSSSYYQMCEEQDDIYYIPFNENERKAEEKKHKGKALVFQSEISNVEG